MIGKITKTALLSIVSKDAAKKYLVDSLESTTGISSKIRQTLAMRIGLDPSQKTQIISLDDILKIIENTHPDLLSEIDEMDEIGISASVGQVHKAKLINGTKVAIKIQYPDVLKNMESGIQKLMTAFVKFGPAKKFQLDEQVYLNYLKQQITNETNYLLESHNQIYFAKLFISKNSVYVPQIFPQLCSKNILVQEWVSGNSLFEIKDSDKEIAARNLTEALLFPFFNHNCLHADFHPGNWSYDPIQKKIILYDFGSILTFSDSEATIMKNIISNFLQNNFDVYHLFIQLGFKSELLEHIKPEFPALAKELFLQFTNHPNKNNLAEFTNDLLGSRKWYFRTAGPAWFMIFLKSLSGFFFSIKNLSSNYSIRSALENYIGDQKTKISYQKNSDANINDIKSFHIFLYKNNIEKAHFQFPILSIQNLEDLIPEEYKNNLNPVQIQNIKQKALLSNYSKQDLFVLTNNDFKCIGLIK